MLGSAFLSAQTRDFRGDLCRRWVSAKTRSLDLSDRSDTLVFHYFRSQEAAQLPPQHRFAGFSLGEDGLLLVYKGKHDADDDSPDFNYGAWYFTGSGEKNLRLVLNNQERVFKIVYLDTNKLVLVNPVQ